MDAAATDKAMIDAGVEIARMMLGGDEVDAVAIVAVDVVENLIGEQFAAI